VRPTGPGARFNRPDRIALGERGRLLVSEDGREDTLRVVESSLAPDEEKRAALAAFQNYGKLVETPELRSLRLDDALGAGFALLLVGCAPGEVLEADAFTREYHGAMVRIPRLGHYARRSAVVLSR
jgi:hypothetical protein